VAGSYQLVMGVGHEPGEGSCWAHPAAETAATAARTPVDHLIEAMLRDAIAKCRAPARADIRLV
jgi:urease accessory protein UreE